MTVSAITSVTAEGQPKELSSFLRSGVLYVVWSDATGAGIGSWRQIRWKPHTSGDFTEIIAPLIDPFNSLSTVYNPNLDSVVAVWDDGTGFPNIQNGNVYIAQFSVTTGAILNGPTLLCQGSNPTLCYRLQNTANLLLYYRTLKTGGVYGRISSDGGLTWQSGEPLLTNKVSSTNWIEIVPYDGTHVSIAQLGSDAYPLTEIGMFARTRPLRSIVPNPQFPGRFFISEPSKFNNTTLTDNQRGALVLSTDNLRLFHLDGVAQGTSDTVGAIAQVQVTGTNVAVLASVGPVGGATGQNFVEYNLTPAQNGLNVTLPGATSYAVDIAVSSTYAYVAEYSDSTTSGQLVMVNLSTGVTTTVLSGLTAVRAVAVTTLPVGNPLIFVGTAESGVERLRVYQENGTTPTLLYNFKVTSRINNITATQGTGSPYNARAYVSMVGSLATYNFYTSTVPLRLIDSYTFSGSGSFFKTAIAPNGNIFAAAGTAGIIVFDALGVLRAQLKLSGEVIPPWKPATAYSLNTLVTARPVNPTSATRLYYRCSTAGTSGASEPPWPLSSTVSDASVVWTTVGVTDSIVTDLTLETSTKRIYAVGTAGGTLGTDGRFWIVSANGLM